jgi:uncharacterized protein YjbJ (UPF0337 family)
MKKNRNLIDKGEGTARELGGKLEKGVGTLLGDEKMEVEGRLQERAGFLQKEDAKTRERIKGKAEEITGAVKNRVGSVLGDDEMAIKGKAREIKGEARQAANEPADEK